MDRTADWLRAAKNEMGWNTSVLSRRAKVDRTTVKRLEDGESKAQPGTIERLARAMRCDPDRVQDYIDGRIELMPLPQFVDPEDDAGQPRNPLRRHVPPNLLHPSLVAVPVINSSAAGTGSSTTDLDYEPGGADKYILLTPDAAADPDAFVVQVKGESGMPFIRPGDWVMCSPNARQVPGALFFVQHTGELDDTHRLKLVIPKGEDEVELRSFNGRQFPPVVVRRDQIAKQAMVLYVIRAMDEIFRYAF